VLAGALAIVTDDKESRVPTGWAIVSAGRHADRKVAPAINAAPDARLVGICSRDASRGADFARRHGASAVYDGLDAMLADERVDAVFVTSPNALHAEHAIRAARAGRHVLVEKPMATTVEDALAMIGACRETGVVLGVGFHLRQHPLHQEARRALASGLGPVTLAQAQWGYGTREAPAPRPLLQQWWEEPDLIGGAASLMGTGVHAIDLLRFLLGREVAAVSAISDGQTPAQPLETVMLASLTFEDGPLAAVSCGRRWPDARNDLHVYGPWGRLSGLGTLAEARQGTLDVASEAWTETRSIPPDGLASYVDEITDFQVAIATGRTPAATGVDGLRAVEIVVALLAAAREGRTVPVRRHAI
jgi:1,5-anhydro-D-fructose reductase (1,5-anhydro-D-mannitol-forming)